MGLLDRTVKRWAYDYVRRELRSSLENPQTPLSFPAEWLLDIFNGGRTDSGIRVSEMTALQTDAVLACTRIITNAVATLPLHIMELMIRDKREAHRKATDHDQYWMLRLRPNPEMTSHTLRVVAMCHALLWGNSYIEIQRNNAAQPLALWPRNPARTRPVRLTKGFTIEGTYFPMGTLVYHTSEVMGDEVTAVDDSENRSGAERIVLAEDMLHVPGLTLDGRLGQSTIYMARQIIGLALAAEKSAAKFYGNGSTPRGVIQLPGTLTGPALETFKRSWQEAYGGENQHKTAVLEKGVTFEAIGLDPEKSQLIQTREFQRKVIASVFNVPVHMIGEGSSSKSTVEQTSIEFLNLTVGPWLNAFEQEFKIKLFPIDSKRQAPFYAKFDTHKLLYPDAESRSKYYQAGRNGGWLNANDIREMEDMNPIEDGSGDIYWAPTNMVDSTTGLLVGQDPEDAQVGALQTKEPPNVQVEDEDGNKGQQPNQPAKGKKPPTPAKPKKSNRDAELIHRYARLYYPMFKDATGRIMKRDAIDSGRFARCFTASLISMTDGLCSDLVPAGEPATTSAQFITQINGYLDGMRFNLQGLAPVMDETYAMREVRRAIETIAGWVEERYNPNHHLQPRKGDGTWHDGKKPFYIGRHSATDDDDAGRWTGWLPTKINARGEKLIDETIEKLKALPDEEKPKRIITSTLPRALYTAQRYATALGIPMTTDWRLNALDLGIFAGMDEEENYDKLKLYIDNPDMPIPGGETVNGYIHRAQEGIDEAFASNEETGPILEVSHSSDVAAYVQNFQGKGLKLDKASAVLSPAGVIALSGKKIKTIAGTFSPKEA